MPRAKGSRRGQMKAYAFFVQTAREEQKRLHPDESVVFADFSRSCAGRWNALNEDEKKPYKAMAERDKVRFDAEIKTFPGEKIPKKQSKQKKPKDPNAPKIAYSPYYWFCQYERQNVKDQNPAYGFVEVCLELCKLWGEAGPEVRHRYQIMSDSDKARYKREMDLYKARDAVPVPQEKGKVGGD